MEDQSLAFVDVDLYDAVDTARAKAIWDRERSCRAFWQALPDCQKVVLTRFVRKTLQKLYVDAEHWVPRSAKKSGGYLDILIRVQYPDLEAEGSDLVQEFRDNLTAEMLEVEASLR